jgi:hypothetical protein
MNEENMNGKQEFHAEMFNLQEERIKDKGMADWRIRRPHAAPA